MESEARSCVIARVLLQFHPIAFAPGVTGINPKQRVTRGPGMWHGMYIIDARLYTGGTLLQQWQLCGPCLQHTVGVSHWYDVYTAVICLDVGAGGRLE